MGTIYNFKTGLGKGLKFILTALIAIAAISGFSDFTLWGLLEQYLKPILGTLTIGGLLTIVNNFIKTKFGGYRRLGQIVFK